MVNGQNSFIFVAITWFVYNLISQATTLISDGDLVIYLQYTFNYTVLSIYKRSSIWEGVIIEIEGKHPVTCTDHPVIEIIIIYHLLTKQFLCSQH